MPSTSVSLLDRLRQPWDESAWRQFVELYFPMIHRWARRAGLRDDEASDVVQEVMMTIVTRIREFEYSRERGRFRSWLKGVAIHKATDILRSRGREVSAEEGLWLNQFSDNVESARFWEEEYDSLLVERALQIMQADFEETSWRACWENVVGGRAAADVGRELGLTEAAVYAAKSRILKRLRQEMGPLLD